MSDVDDCKYANDTCHETVIGEISVMIERTVRMMQVKQVTTMTTVTPERMAMSTTVMEEMQMMISLQPGHNTDLHLEGWMCTGLC
jgi:hypothetical protein